MQKKLISHNFPKSKNTFRVTNPANGKTIATLPLMDVTQLKKQIDSAHKAFEGWSALNGFERASLMQKWYALIIKHKEDIALIMHTESGKLIEESRTEVEYAAGFISWSAEEAKRITGEILTMPNANYGYVIKQPVGVVGAITPWNFPAAMITRKAAPALAAGCTVVVKPPRETPLTAIALFNLAVQAGIPKDVFQVTLGDSNIFGKEFCTNKKIRKISFTGSTEVGKILMKQCGDSVKKLTLELGGNAPFIVFDDADIDKAVDGAVKSRFRNSGQTCVCANRFLVADKIHDEFTKKLTAAVKKLKLAPLINEKAVQKVDALVKGSNGRIQTGGKYKGCFYEPTVISNLQTDSVIFATEIFGPVATIFKFKTDAEAIKLANRTEYGLAAYLYSGNMARGLKAAQQLDFGMVGVNEPSVSSSHSPFGGMKESGFGKEGSHYGIDEYLEKKYINIAA